LLQPVAVAITAIQIIITNDRFINRALVKDNQQRLLQPFGSLFKSFLLILIVRYFFNYKNCWG